MTAKRHRLLAFTAVAATLAVILAATTFPGAEPLDLPVGCFVCGDLGGIDVTLNILLYVPYGAALWLAMRRVWAVTGVGFATSLIIELLQFSVIVNRDANIGDLVTNTMGTAIGARAVAFLPAAIAPAQGMARRFSLTALGGWLAILYASAWLLSPASTDGVWFGQWTPDLRHWERFRGTLLHAEFNRVALVSGPIADATQLKREFAEGRIAVDAIAVPTVPSGPRRIAPIVSVFDDKQDEILLVGQGWRNLVFRIRTNANRARVRGTAVSLGGVFPVRGFNQTGLSPNVSMYAGDTTTIRVTRYGGRISLSAEFGKSHLSREFMLHQFLGWHALLPFEFALGEETTMVSMLWAAFLLFLPGYWHSRDWRIWTIVPAAALIFAGLVVVPAVSGLSPTPYWAWLASALGFAGGWISGRVVSRLIRQASIPGTTRGG